MLNPAGITITHHALERYLERRGWNPHDKAARLDAEYCIREILSRCAHQNPPLIIKPGKQATRRYKQGGMVWITNSDSTILITMFHHEVTRKAKVQKGRHEARRR